MEQNTYSTPEYTMGYGEGYMQFATRADPHEILRYMLPTLRSGIRVLDAGCGTGIYSTALARAINPGELHGVDVSEEQVGAAAQLALESGCENASFRVADVLELPFPSAFFDLVHCNDILAYISDTGAALEEIKRVLRPGGILACREMIIEASYAHPDFGYGRRGWEVFIDLLEADDGHPHMGKELKLRLNESGFADVRISSSFETYSDPEDILSFTKMVTDWFLMPGITESAKLYGAATDRIFAGVEDYVRQWSAHPGAIACIAFGQAVAIRP